MKVLALVFGLVASTFAQDVVQVICSENSITAKIQKQVVQVAGYGMEDVHLNDQACVFDDEDEKFYIKRISPLSSCKTHHETNETHVTYTNSISTVLTGPTFPYGVVVGSAANSKVLSAKIVCSYRIDLNVSTMFIPNITIIPIQVPDAFGKGEFRASMSLFTDNTYRIPFATPPTLNPDEILYVGVNLLGNPSDEFYLLMQECWGTISDDPNASPKYPLIDAGCPVSSSSDGAVQVTRNGIAHQGTWNSPVFKFVGNDANFDNVWLHCDLQLCINKACQPTCPARRKRDVSPSDDTWGPGDFTEQHIITSGPITKFKITLIGPDQIQVTYEEDPEANVPAKQTGPPAVVFNSTVITVVAVAGGFALLCLVLAIVVVASRYRRRSTNTGFDLSGANNKGFVA